MIRATRTLAFAAVLATAMEGLAGARLDGARLPRFLEYLASLPPGAANRDAEAARTQPVPQEDHSVRG